MSKVLDSLRPYEQQIDDMKPFFAAETMGKEDPMDSRAFSMIQNEGSLEASRSYKRSKYSNQPLSPPSQTAFSFAKKTES